MKIITRTKMYLPMAALILTAALSNPAAAQTSCEGLAPGCFKGFFQGQDFHDTALPPGATTLVIRTIATGTGNHLNQFLLVKEFTGNLLNLSSTGSAQWIAANGDRINTTLAGQAKPSEMPGSLEVTETHTITGGTGRFTGAQGQFTVVFLHKLEPSGVAGGFQTHDTFGSFQGTITLPGAAN
jgi:hypothetical protein